MSLDTWILREDQLPICRQNVGNILFTIGNGVLGVAGVSSLAPRGSQGMFAGGLYADGPADMHWMPEPGHAARNNERFPNNDDIHNLEARALIACPRVFAVRVKWNGSDLDRRSSFTRSLDLQRGILTCASTVSVPGGTLQLVDHRFVSCDDRHVLVQRLEVTSTISGTLEVVCEIDATSKNQDAYDLWSERTVSADGETLSWRGVANGTSDKLSICQCIRAKAQPKFVTTSPLTPATAYKLNLTADEISVIERFIGVGFTTYDADPSAAARSAALSAVLDGFDACAERQHNHWKTFWTDNDIVIEGCDQDQLAVRYSLFQLHSATPPADGTISFGAKFLSGEWYRACVFWDTDVFIGPYLTRTQPDASRSHLLYRYKTLNEARKAAKKWNCEGARYPLESLPPTGEDVALPWIIFGATEIHTSCDVAWAILDYFNWTGDREFMNECGGEILAETARFWMSRFTRTERGLELLGVCGPDEYHPVINNSVYTSTLARENLKAAVEHANTSDEEKQAWLEAAEDIVCQQPDDRGVVEQYDGFFQLPDWHRGQYVERAVEYQLLKQADVVMLPLMLPDLYPIEVTRANYDYYESHTVHDSSLSAGVHAIVAAWLGLIDEAYDKFRFTAYMQLDDRLENTHMGLHAACIGMVPRIVIEGFAGLRIKNNEPVACPNLPPAWNGVSFGFSYRGFRYRCRVGRQSGEQAVAITQDQI